MIVDYENSPKNSILYSGSIILTYFESHQCSITFDRLYQYCKNQKMEYSIFILTIDWLFLIGVIKEINKKNEVVLCN
ncbi:ABC-three component system middle component 6 [Megasphaera sueciensis]|jgi:hypothetical protein|uniref:ABC-three component system middle component 6 n=1 Tax=Megasphaera sueciensis TaxID=349094 RepID=UPI003D08D7C2